MLGWDTEVILGKEDHWWGRMDWRGELRNSRNFMEEERKIYCVYHDGYVMPASLAM